MKQLKNRINTIIVAGPCAAESEEQISIAIDEAKKRKIDFLRINLWKPRTKPGFEGLGEKGISLLIKAAKAGVNPGLEVITPSQAELVVNSVLPHLKKGGKLLLWIGSRNQNHFIQREISQIVARDKRVYLMIKNQPWISEDHWEGIVGHVLDGGINREQLIICHRGFTPNGHNPHGYRNVPEHTSSIKIKNKTNLPMVFDPSHTGGSVENVMRVAKEAALHNYDGVIVEVHHSPKDALTDAKQQLTWTEFDGLLSIMNMN